MERPADAVFNSCGHCFCTQCSELSTCPRCLQDVAGKTRVFGRARMLADMLAVGEAVGGRGGEACRV